MFIAVLVELISCEAEEPKTTVEMDVLSPPNELTALLHVDSDARV